MVRVGGGEIIDGGMSGKRGMNQIPPMIMGEERGRNLFLRENATRPRDLTVCCFSFLPPGCQSGGNILLPNKIFVSNFLEWLAFSFKMMIYLKEIAGPLNSIWKEEKISFRSRIHKTLRRLKKHCILFLQTLNADRVNKYIFYVGRHRLSRNHEKMPSLSP